MFLKEGYKVYVVDRPGHGRSPRHPDVLGRISPPVSYELVMSLFARGRAERKKAALCEFIEEAVRQRVFHQPVQGKAPLRASARAGVR